MSTIRRSRVSSLWIAIAVLGGASMAGCGSTGRLSGTMTNAPGGSNSALRFSQCMRANGVPNFPDPGPSGSRRRAAASTSSRPPSRAHSTHAQAYLPPSGNSPPVPASVRRQELLLANCMRANGVPNFPDPDANGNIQFPDHQPHSPVARVPARTDGPCKKYSDALGP